MRISYRIVFALFLSVLLGQAAPAADPAAKVVVSIQPIHSLVAAVMSGVGTPTLLIKGGASPHTASLRPSDARALSAADLIVWVGPGLERFLVKPLDSLAGRARRVTLIEEPGLTLRDVRAAHGHDDRHGHDEAAAGAVDPHIWLDPTNAARIVEVVAAALSGIDPGNAATYRANAAGATDRLNRLDRDLAARLAPVATRPFVAFHDAYQYFEAHYGLNGVGALALGPEQQPGAKRLAEVRETIRARGVVCVFAEPQFEPALIRTVIAGTSARGGVLDPLGADLPPGPDAYFALMRAMADALVDCLTRQS